MRKVVTPRPAAATSVAVLTIGLMMGLMSRTDATPVAVPPVAPQTSYSPVAEVELRVVGESANLRERPSPSSRVLGKLHRGTKVIVLERVSRGWARVEANNTQGYVDTEQGVMALDLDQGF